MNETKDEGCVLDLDRDQAKTGGPVRCEICESVATVLHRDDLALHPFCDQHSQELLEAGKIGKAVARCPEGWTERAGWDGFCFSADPDLAESRPVAMTIINGIPVEFPGDPHKTAITCVEMVERLGHRRTGQEDDSQTKGENDV